MHIVDDHPIARAGAGQLAALILAAVQSPLILWGPDGRVVAFNDAFCLLFGYTPEEARDLHWIDLMHPDDRAAGSKFISSRSPDELHQIHWESRVVRADGHDLFLGCTSSAIPVDGVSALLTEFRDLTDHERSQTVIEGLQVRYRRVVERAPVAIFTTGPDDRFRSANPMCIELLGRPIEELRTLRPLDLVHPDDVARALARRQALEEIGGARNELDPVLKPFELLIERPYSGSIWCEVLMLPRYDDQSNFLGLDGFARDISEERRLQQELEDQAGSDALTNLANRRRLDLVLAERFNEARRYGNPLSLLMLDLDHFKPINDTLGHLAGDAVLKSVAEALTDIGREADVIARYGGEEFAVVLPQTDAAGAAAAAERCRTAIEVLITEWEGTPIQITASVGAATYYPTIHESPTALLADADAAVYAAKHAGRNTVCIANDLAPEVTRLSA